MIVDERLVTYINSLDAGNTAMLDQIEREATADYVPIIRKEMQSFLKFLLAMKKPARILEVGTAVGFSAILMAEYDPVPCQITTIENYEKRIPIARENFKRAGKEAQIALLEGAAAEVLKTRMILFLWTRQKGSTFISCRRFCAFWRRTACWCRTMCCRTAM